ANYFSHPGSLERLSDFLTPTSSSRAVWVYGERAVPGPANYFSHPGSLERLSDFLTPTSSSRAVWVYGERA
ncbi:hypothetical protein CQA88_32140, partial [Klebsiella pneumoniae]